MDIEKTIKEILDILRNSPKALKLNEITMQMSVRSDTAEYDAIKETLNNLCNDGIVARSTRRRYMLKDYDNVSTLKGVIRVKDERGVVLTNSPAIRKVIIKQRHMSTALDEDTVCIRLLAMRANKKPHGEVVEVLHRAPRTITGTIDHDGSFYFLIPDEDKYLVDFLIPENKLNGAGDKDKVAAKFLVWDDPLKSPQVEVTEIIGKAGEPKTEFNSIMKEFSLPRDFSKEVEDEASVAAKPVSAQIIKDRLDLRKVDIITIDPEDAKDFDDALSLDILENGNYRLGVHIADVSHYVKEAFEIDFEALNRATSVYLVDRVVPMLPESLSNDMCSLKPNRVRLAFSVFMEFNKNGVLKSYDIKETVIKSKRRFTYNEVLEIIQTGKGDYSELIARLQSLALILRNKRFKMGGVNFETSEVKFVLDENKMPLRAIIKEANDATRLVEECMLAANKTVAEHVKNLSKTLKMKRVLPFLYRIHDEPHPDKIKDVVAFVGTFGSGHTVEGTSSKALNNFLDKFEGRPEKAIIHQMLIRAMPKAEYSSENIGHYGLGFKDYTHFTSPIRRYPDLVVHRLLKKYMKDSINLNLIKTLDKKLEDIGIHCTDREKASMEAERASTKLTQAVLASKFIGQEFEGTVSGITSFGLFVMLDGLLAEGLLHIRDLTDDYYMFDERSIRLIGKRTGRVFHFGNRLKVQIIHVNVEKRRIDLKFVEPEKPKPRVYEERHRLSNKGLEKKAVTPEKPKSRQRSAKAGKKKTVSNEKR